MFPSLGLLRSIDNISENGIDAPCFWNLMVGSKPRVRLLRSPFGARASSLGTLGLLALHATMCSSSKNWTGACTRPQTNWPNFLPEQDNGFVNEHEWKDLGENLDLAHIH